MSSIRRAVLIIFAALILIGVFSSDDTRELGPTTFGKLPQGFGALYDLLSELGIPTGRTYLPSSRLPPSATVWWIQPEGVCERAEMKLQKRRLPPPAWDAKTWMEQGGTAVVFLPQSDEPETCNSVAGFALPWRPSEKEDHEEKKAEHPSKPEQKEEPKTWVNVQVFERLKHGTHLVEGKLAPTLRDLEIPEAQAFKDSGDWEVVATIDSDPYALERSVGKGRLVVFADARFLRNGWLGEGDGAPLAMDIVRAYGAPLIDERAHGLREADSAILFIAASPAAYVFVGLLLIGALFVWHGALTPQRAVKEADLAAPTLETFVDSQAGLYAGTRDFSRVLERYRALAAAALRRHFCLPPETPPEALVERLRMHRRIPPQAANLLTQDKPVRNQNELRAAVRALDSIVWEATR